MRRAAVICVVVGLLASGCGSTRTVTVTSTVTTVRTVTTTRTATTTGAASTPPCRGADLQATFSVIPGSAGAGQISYELTLTNASTSACSVAGLPVATLLDKSGGALPTQVSAASASGTGTAVVLQHGQSAKVDARFSPDVPGAGEQHTGPCERTAYALGVAVAGGGTVNAPIAPPTPVCEEGTLSFSAFAASR